MWCAASRMRRQKGAAKGLPRCILGAVHDPRRHFDAQGHRQAGLGYQAAQKLASVSGSSGTTTSCKLSSECSLTACPMSPSTRSSSVQ
eukprot:281370-Chlamydomonas_euryale.AAC.1